MVTFVKYNHTVFLLICERPSNMKYEQLYLKVSWINSAICFMSKGQGHIMTIKFTKTCVSVNIQVRVANVN